MSEPDADLENVSLHEVECPCCRDETFEHRDFLMDHLQIYHSAAEVYVAMEDDST